MDSSEQPLEEMLGLVALECTLYLQAPDNLELIYFFGTALN